MKKEYTQRINLDVNLNIISKIICKEYNLGTFISNNVLYFGYGDFNYKLHSTKGVYVIKIINKECSDNECNEIVARYIAPFKHGVNCPKIYTAKNGDTLLKIKPNKTCYRLFVMQYLPYKNLYNLNYKMLPHDFELIGEQLAIINRIDYKPKFIYDSWAIESLSQEYNNFDTHKLPNTKIKNTIESIINQLNNIEVAKLPRAYIHGDVVDMNILKSKNGFYIVDFSSANYQIRICDLATTIADMCYNDGNFENNIYSLLHGYSKHIQLTNYELQLLPLFTKAATIVGYLNCINSIETNDGEYNNQLMKKYLLILTGDTNDKTNTKTN